LRLGDDAVVVSYGAGERESRLLVLRLAAVDALFDDCDWVE